MKTITVLALVSVVCLLACNGSTTSQQKTVFNKDFNWSIQVPDGFESVPPEEWYKLQNRGADAIEATYDANIENNATSLFVFRADPLNYFEANYQPFDTTTDGDYLENVRNVNALLYGTFAAQLPNARLDSSSTVETIDGKTFQQFSVVITYPNKMLMECLLYSRLFGKKEFSVNLMTVDKQKQAALLKAFRNSTFKSE